MYCYLVSVLVSELPVLTTRLVIMYLNISDRGTLDSGQTTCHQGRPYRHVRGVRPNRAAKFTGAAILGPTKIKLASLNDYDVYMA